MCKCASHFCSHMKFLPSVEEGTVSGHLNNQLQDKSLLVSSKSGGPTVSLDEKFSVVPDADDPSSSTPYPCPGWARRSRVPHRNKVRGRDPSHKTKVAAPPTLCQVWASGSLPRSPNLGRVLRLVLHMWLSPVMFLPLPGEVVGVQLTAPTGSPVSGAAPTFLPIQHLHS